MSKLGLIILLFLASCGVSQNDDYLFDGLGFDVSETPEIIPTDPSSPSRIAPDHYYRKSKNYSKGRTNANARTQARIQQPLAQNPQPVRIQQQRQQPVYQYPKAAPSYYYPPQSYQQQVAPASRLYSNPYAIPPTQGSQLYDADQYYTPPVQSRNVESVETISRNVPKY